MEIWIVKVPHKTSYENPICISKGENIHLTGRTDIWDGHCWVWAVAPDGREGWIPDDFVSINSGCYVASRDYSAKELTCLASESLRVLDRTHGWAWCKNTDDEYGWVPLKNFVL